MLLHHFDHPLPWKQSKMATKHNYLKSLKLQSDCMQINFLFSLYKHNAIFSFTKDFVWLLCFSFIVLFTFYACKNYTNISDQHKTKTNITIYKSLGKSKDQYIYKHHTNFQDSNFTQSGALGFYNWEKGVKVRMWENTHEKKEKHLTWYESPWPLTKIIRVKDTMHAKQVTEQIQEMLKCQNQPLSHSHSKRQFDRFRTPVPPLRLFAYHQ